jgi:hypothetical protein
MSAQVQLKVFSEIVQRICGMQVEQKPCTAAFNVTCPFAATAAEAGETVTVTLLASYPPPLPQPTTAISRASTPLKEILFII